MTEIEKRPLPEKYFFLQNLSKEDASIWLAKEIEYWSVISGHSSTCPDTELTNSLQAYLQNLHQLKGQNVEFFPSVAKITRNFRLPFHSDKNAEDLRKQAMVGNISSAIFAYRLAVTAEEQGYGIGHFDGYLMLEKETATRINQSLELMEKDCVRLREETLSTSKTANTSIEQTVLAATDAIMLSEPVKFWNERRETHRQNAKKYATHALQSAVGFGTALIFLIFYEYSAGRPIAIGELTLTMPSHNFGIAFLILLTSAGIWSVRVFIKLMMANLVLETESLERATMIKTFVAMTAINGETAKENQLLFFTTLFRPTNNSLNEEQTAPELSKLLELVIKSRGN